MIDPNDLIGSRINYLVVIKYIGKPLRHHIYLCRCECGVEKRILRSKLVAVRPQESCGCINIKRSTERLVKIAKRHGLSRSSIYARWSGMMSRCYQRQNKKYSGYGGRGIKVCRLWHDFDAFFKSMGHPPFSGATLDRIDVNWNYSPENCRWATQKVQQNNRRDTRILTVDGISRPVTEWARISGVSPKVLRQRIDRDRMSVRDAIWTGSYTNPKLDEVIIPK